MFLVVFIVVFLHYLHIYKQYLIKTTGGQKQIFIIAWVKGAGSHVPESNALLFV